MPIYNLLEAGGKALRLAKFEIRMQQKKAVLSLAWVILWPLLLTGGFVSVFDVAEGWASSTRLDAVLLTYFGILTWVTLSTVLIRNLNVLRANRATIIGFVFRFSLLPVVDATVRYIFFVVQLTIAVTIWLLMVPHNEWYLVVAYLSIYLCAFYLAVLAMAWLASLLGALTPDITPVLSPLLLLLLALSPVFQRGDEALHWSVQTLNELNPFSACVEIFYSSIGVMKDGPTAPVAFLGFSMVAVLAARLLVRYFYRQVPKVI